MSGPGARNTVTASPTTLAHLPLGAPRTGIGPPPPSVAKGHLITRTHLTPSPRAFITTAGSVVGNVRKMNSGKSLSKKNITCAAGGLKFEPRRRYLEKKCCLPLGGPRSHHEPPAHKQCPPNDWSWSEEHGHCVPHHPRPYHHPAPRCAKDWEWSFASFCCERSPHHPHPPQPKPSGVHHDGWKRVERSLPSGNVEEEKRSSRLSRALQLCPKGLRACPIAAPSGLTGDYECLDTTHELESCGGCASTGEGQDCTAIKGVWNVGCVEGRCASK